MSSARSGSRYPSAYGHTPSYRSYVRGGVGASDYTPSSSFTSTRPITALSTDPSFSAYTPGNVYDLGLTSAPADLSLGLTGSGSSASKKVSSYSSSYRY